MIRGGGAPASRESTDYIEEVNLANSMRRYLRRKDIDLTGISDQALLTRVRRMYPGRAKCSCGKNHTKQEHYESS